MASFFFSFLFKFLFKPFLFILLTRHAPSVKPHSTDMNAEHTFIMQKTVHLFSKNTEKNPQKKKITQGILPEP